MSAGVRHLKSTTGLPIHRSWAVTLAVLLIAGLMLAGLASTAFAAPMPTFSADPHWDGISGSDWPTGTPTIISVYETAGASLPSFETSVAEDARDPDNGNFWQYLGGPYGWDLQSGQKVVVHNGETTKTTVVTGLTVDRVDASANTVWGTTDPGVGGDIQVYDHDELNSSFSDPGFTGAWSYDFTSGGGLQQGWAGLARQTDADGDSTVAEWHVPDPHLVVDPGSARIEGQDWGLRENVTVTVYPVGSATAKLIKNTEVDENWSFGIDSEVAIRAGDRVVATDGHTLTTMTVSPLAITSFDAATGVTRGVCTAKNPPASMTGGIDYIGGGPIFPSTAGTWTATFDAPPLPLPLPPGTQGWVVEHDPSGNSTQARWRVPEKPIAVDHHFEVVEDTTLTAGFLAGCTYYGPTLDSSFTAQPKHGTVMLAPGMGAFAYRPSPGFSGVDTFRYSIADSTPWQTLWADPATITVTVRPWYLGYSSLTTTTIQLQWPDTADMLTDFDHYLVTDNGGPVASTTSTSRTLDDLTPGSVHTFGISMVDASGHESYSRTLTITIPNVTAQAVIETTPSATVELGVEAPGSGGSSGAQTATVTVVMTDVTTGGQLTLVKSDAPPADAPATLKFLGEYFDLGFTGSFKGSATITIPYDPRIPDSRAIDLKLQHWAADHWEDLATTVDLAHHTLTASVTTLSPIVVAEPIDAVVAAKLVLPSTVFFPTYGGRTTLTASLLTSDLAATPLAGFTLVLERQSGAAWSHVATLSPVTGSPGSYRTSVTPVGGVRTVFRVRLATNALYSATSAVFYVVPHAKLGTPRPSTTSVAHGHRFYVSGQVNPKRSMYVYVRIYKYSRGAYRYASTSRVKSTSTGSYRLAVLLKRTGYYKFKAYVGDDTSSATVARTYSSMSARVRVR